MRFVPSFFLVTLAACASLDESAPYPAAQDVVDEVAERHPNLTRLTLHAVPADGTECTQIASTMPERRGKPSDPEDLEALRTGEEIVLEEPGAIDVTVPILVQDGRPSAIAGITLRAHETSDREGIVSRARSSAEELETEIRAAGRPLW